MERSEITWLAGLIEGEGTFFRRTRAATQGVSWVFALEMVDKDVVQKARDIWGYGTIRPIKARGLGKQDRWIWRFEHNNEIYALGAAIYQFMGARRKKAIREMFLEIPGRRKTRRSRRCD